MTDSRAQLRRASRARRKELSPSARIAGAEAFADRLLASRWMPQSGFVAGYWAVDSEIGLHALQLRMPPSCTYCLPILGDDDILRFAAWGPGAPLVTNRFGIPEPDVVDALLMPGDMAMVVVPLVAFDRSLHRLGMGGGWYDRSFAFRRDQATAPDLIGAAFSVQQVDSIDSEEWDVPLDAVCTELEIFPQEISGK